MKSQVHLSYLKDGTFINTKFSSCNAWYQNMVYRSDEENVYISLADNFLENTILIGTNIVLKYETEYFQYIYEGTVSDIILDEPRYVSIQISQTEELVNSRAFPRHDTYLPLKLRPVQDEKYIFSVITNISLMGVAFVSNRILDTGEECEMLIYLPNRKVIDAKGKMVRKSSKTNLKDYGIQFTEMTEENSILLSEYFCFMDEKIQATKSNYHNNIAKYFVKIH